MKKIYQISVIIIFAMLVLVACENNANISLQEALVTESSTVSEVELQTQICEEEDVSIYVYVCGAVVTPGVYEVYEGDRQVRAIELAGGFLPEAAKEAINLAQLVEDGMQITVPTLDELAETEHEEAMALKGMVNINTASLEELCQLDGIGEAKANDILAYREEHGGFLGIEELKNISGIGENVYKGIVDSVYID